MLNFRKNNKSSDDILEEEEEKNDYFSGPDLPDEPKKQKTPPLQPEDPAYWLREEGQWEHLKPRRRRIPKWVYLTLTLILVLGCLAVWLRYFRPYIDEATQFGYIDNVQHRGTLFKSYEGTLLPYRSLMDTTKVYSHDFTFSTTNDSVGRKLMEYAHSGKPVSVRYRQFHATLPWRGETKTIITEVDTVEAELLLPPDRRPDTRTEAGMITH